MVTVGGYGPIQPFDNTVSIEAANVVICTDRRNANSAETYISPPKISLARDELKDDRFSKSSTASSRECNTMMVVPKAVTELMGPITGYYVNDMAEEDGLTRGHAPTVNIFVLKPMLPFPLATGGEVRDIP